MVSKRVATFAIAAFITLLANVMHLTSSYIVKTDASINAGKVLVVRFELYGLLNRPDSGTRILAFLLKRNSLFRSFIQVAVFGIWSAIHLFQVRQNKKENRPEVKENDESSQSQGFIFFLKS